jgi:hypothetical protein
MDDQLAQRLSALEERAATLDRKIEYLFAHLRLTFVDDRPPPDDILKLALTGNMIDAIKEYRLRFRVGLAEAKTAVEEMIAKRRGR